MTAVRKRPRKPRATKAVSPNERVCLFILGMHRSGTSSVAGTLIKLGAAAPSNILGANEGNQAGHWESEPLIAFHDELLASAGSRWDDWRAFNPDWYDTPVAAQFKARAKQLLEQEFRDASLFVFKDPRNCRLARFWLDIFAERGIAPKIILPIRSPLEVARSHRARDRFPLRKGLLLWLRHVLDAEIASRDLPRVVVEYGAFLKDWQSAVAVMEQALGAFPANTDLSAAEVDGFLSDDLQHQRDTSDELVGNALVHAWVEQTYAAMLELARNPGSNSAWAALDEVREKFNVASTFFGGVLADMEASLAEVERVSREAQESRQEALTQLTAAQHERDAQAAEAARLPGLEASLAEVERRARAAEESRQEVLAQLTVVQQERDAQAAEAAQLTKAVRASEQTLAQLTAAQQGRDAQMDEVARLSELLDRPDLKNPEKVDRSTIIFGSGKGFWQWTCPLLGSGSVLRRFMKSTRPETEEK